MCAKMRSIKIVFTGKRVVTPNDPKLSDRGVRRGTCMAGGKAAAEAGAVTHGAVRCSAWLAVAVIWAYVKKTTPRQSCRLIREVLSLSSSRSKKLRRARKA